MNFISRTHTALGILIGAIVIAGILYFVEDSIQEKQDIIQKKEPIIYKLQETVELPLEVSGTLSATDSITVYARTAGILESILVEEGNIVQKGAKLFVQDTSVIDGAIAVAVAQGALEDVSVVAQYSSQFAQSKKTDVSAELTSESEKLQTESYNASKDQLHSALYLSIKSSETELISALDFIDVNRRMFPSRALDIYAQVLTNLYGQQPSYLNNGLVRRTSPSEKNIFHRIDTLNENSPAAELLTVSEDISTEVDRVFDIFELAETEFLDESKVQRNDVIYTEYLKYRSGLSALKSEILSTQTRLLAQLPQEQKALLSATQSNLLAKIDLEEADNQVTYAQERIDKSSILHNAQVEALLSQKQLAQAVAPFSAIVEKVFVDQGQYMQPGEPVVVLQGTGGLELRTTIPMQLLPLLEEGQEFKVGDKVVGHVHRFSPTASNGVVTVFITIDTEEESYVSGQTLSGTLLLKSNNSTVVKIPRKYIYFATYGPFVYTPEGKEVPVNIIYDNMDYVFIEKEEVLMQGILFVTGVTL